MLTSADKGGGSKKGQKHADVILEWSQIPIPLILQIIYTSPIFSHSVFIVCFYIKAHFLFCRGGLDYKYHFLELNTWYVT